jgi:endonuclease-3
MSAPESLRYVIQNLRATYGIPKREERTHVPLDPLDVLIETVLSQSTSDRNSERAFANLKQKYPSWELARRARVTSIEAVIRSGGLAKQKSARIKQLLTEIHRRRGSLDLNFLYTVPLDDAVEFLSSFKGVGPKTVACTLLFACGRPIFPVDTHIFRVGRRLGLIPERCSDAEAHRLMTAMVPRGRHYEVHINLIRHGRTVCRPQNPACEQCCVLEYCRYYEEHGVLD